MGADEFFGFEERELGFGTHEAGFVDAAEFIHAAGAVGLAPGLGRAERAEMDVADAFFVEAGGEQFLGGAGAAGIGDVARVDDACDAGGLQTRDEARQRRVFVADGEEGGWVYAAE